MRRTEPGTREVVRLVGGTVVAALSALRLYAFLHDFARQSGDGVAWLTSLVALVLFVAAVRLLARTLGEA